VCAGAAASSLARIAERSVSAAVLLAAMLQATPAQTARLTLARRLCLRRAAATRRTLLSPPRAQLQQQQPLGWLRSAPLAVGAASVALLVANRLLSGEALTTDASTAQSRAEVLVLVLSSTNMLTARGCLLPPALAGSHRPFQRRG
jgi:Cofactor assembly of complex C subunit B, CCB2/CCB4